jgi:hypothetical protein
MDWRNADIRFLGLPWWALAAAGALCLLLLFWYWRYLRRVAFPGPLAPLALRFAAMACLLLLAANPALFITTKQPVPRRVAVLVDTSQSMSLEDESGGRTRFVRALHAARLIHEKMKSGRTWPFGFSRTVAPASPDSLAAKLPHGPATYIMESLADPETGEGLPLTDIVLITDGRDNSGMAPAPPGGVRVHAVALGAPGPDVNVSLGDVDAPDVAFVNKPVTLAGDVWLAGVNKGRGAAVELFREDNRIAGASLKARGPDPHGLPWSVTFTPRQTGMHVFMVRARAADLAEKVTQDNARPVFLNVISGKRKALIVDAPRWDFAFLNRLLAQQEKIEIHTLLVTAQGPRGNAPRGVLGSTDRLAEYSLVLFGDAARAATHAERSALLQYLRRGGSVILFGGENSLFAAPDAQWRDIIRRASPSGAGSGEAFYAQLTPSGRGNPLLRALPDPGANAEHWAALPYLYSFHPLNAPQGADILAEHPWVSCGARKCPLIIALKAGRGRLLMLPVQGLWRWRLARQETAAFETVWNNVFSALMEPEETRPVRLSLPKRYYPLGGEICLEARVEQGAARAAAPVLSIKGQGGSAANLPMARKKDSPDFYSACFNPEAAGVFTAEARAGGESSGPEPFAVTVSREEFLLTSTNSALLDKLCGDSGGSCVDEKHISRLVETLNRPGAYTAVREERNMWSAPWCWFVLGFVLCVLSLEWILRRRGGLT